ncbi:MAG: NUDIX domain-containing protein [bacterium]|nr:NUDIX domain-containing protein [bacterium]
MQIKLKIKSTTTGEIFNVIYSEGDPHADLDGKKLQAIHAFCFCGDKMVLVKHPRTGWMPPGGGIEPGETYEEAVVREVEEETNMKVIHQELIGFQDIYEPIGVMRQTRNFCIVEPYGNFVTDPDGEIMEIKLIDPKDYKDYFNWGEIGERIMARAMELKTRPHA